MSDAVKTGYPSIDRPWEEFYKNLPEKPMNDMPWKKYLVDDTPIGSQPPQGLTMYQLIHDVNKDYPDQIALNYFGKKTTFREMFQHIDESARALTAAGVKKKQPRPDPLLRLVARGEAGTQRQIKQAKMLIRRSLERRKKAPSQDGQTTGNGQEKI